MIRIARDFVNEEGNKIEMSVCHDDRGVTISAIGPTSQVEHTWTPDEANQLFDLLSLIRPAYKADL